MFTVNHKNDKSIYTPIVMKHSQQWTALFNTKNCVIKYIGVYIKIQDVYKVNDKIFYNINYWNVLLFKQFKCNKKMWLQTTWKLAMPLNALLEFVIFIVTRIWFILTHKFLVTQLLLKCTQISPTSHHSMFMTGKMYTVSYRVLQRWCIFVGHPWS